MTGKPIPLNKDTSPPEATPAALAVGWWQFVRAAEGAGISDEDSEALIERADAVLDRLAEIPASTVADLAAKILAWNCECDGGETIIGMRLQASIVADAQRFAGPELAGIMPDLIPTERPGLLEEARERGAVWSREHVLRPHGLLAAVPAVLCQALAADLSSQRVSRRLTGLGHAQG